MIGRDKKQALADSWARNAANWTRAVRDGRIASRTAGTDAALLDAIAARKPRRFLDAGCGEGFHVRRIAEMTGWDAVGFDGSAALIEAARAADPDNRYEVLSYDAFVATPAAIGGPFDVVAFNYALFDEDVTPLLAAARRVLAPDGAVVIQTLHPDAMGGEDGWRTEDFAAFGDGDWTPMPWYFRTLESWTAVIADAGLTRARVIEPAAGPGGAPLSLLMICEGAGIRSV
jgi:SAM-dependent methyltransferase